jgi:Carboxypeptidase regulatory-like domain
MPARGRGQFAEVPVRIVGQFVLEMICVGVCALMQPAIGVAQTDQPQSLANVQGKVVEEVSGQGIRKVIVRLSGDGGEPHQEYITATDAFGQFRIEGVLPGQYSVTVTHLGFVLSSSGAEPQPITVTSGQSVKDLLYKMQATGVITGRITEADGDPLQGVSVWVTRIGQNGNSLPNGGPAEGEGGPANETTNDLGEYRIANLRAGQYVVHAELHGMPPPPDPADRGKQRDRGVYALTYYPGTADERSATPVRVTPGATVIANFNMLVSRSYRVSGTVIVQGNPRNVQMFLVSDTGQTEAQQLQDGGRFEFLNIMPGTYVAQIVDMSSASDGQGPQGRTQIIGSPIIVGSSDVTGLVLQPESGGSITGKLRTEDGETLDWTKLDVDLVRVAQDSDPPQLGAIGALGGNAPVAQDGSFELKDVAGASYQVALISQADIFRDYYVKSVTQDGREVVDTGFTVNGDTTLNIVISSKGASIDGTVTDGHGQPVASATVVSVPTGGTLKRPDAYQTEKTDASGHFLMRGMNPGPYILIALEGVQEDVRNPEFLQKYGERGTTVDLDEGQRKTVVVNLQDEKQ